MAEIKTLTGKDLKRWRLARKLGKTQMVNLLIECGLDRVNWATYHKWEEGDQTPGTMYAIALPAALEQIEAKFKADPDFLERRRRSRMTKLLT